VAVLPALDRSEDDAGAFAVLKANYAVFSPPQRYRSCIRCPCLKVAGSDSDVLRVTDIRDSILRMPDALPLMADFSRGEPRVS
jgi:hypothetical protein